MFKGLRQLYNPNKATPNTRCQKCLKLGHHTYECTNARPYRPRPSQSKQLAMGGGPKRDTPSVQVPDEFKVPSSGVGLADKILKAKEAERAKALAKDKSGTSTNPKKKQRRASISSDNDSDLAPPRKRRAYSPSDTDDSKSTNSSDSASTHPSESRRARRRYSSESSTWRRRPLTDRRSRSPRRTRDTPSPRSSRKRSSSERLITQPPAV